MPERPPPPPNIVFHIRPNPDAPPVPLGRLLFALFFRPLDIFRLLESEKLGRVILRMLLASLICGMLLVVARLPGVREEVNKWGHWLETEMGDVRLTDSSIVWTPARPLPYSRHFRNWRVNFTDQPVSGFDPIKRYGPESRGLWISPGGVVMWQRMAGKDRVSSWPISAEKLVKALPAGESTEAGTGRRLSFDRHTRWLATLFLAGGMGITTLLGVMWDVFFYATLFSVIPVLLRGGRGGMVFSRTLVFYLTISLVPLVVATVYSLVKVPMLDFNTVFAVVFMLYLGFIIIGTRVRLAREQKKKSDQ